MKTAPKRPVGKQAQRGVYAKEEGDMMGKKKKTLVSYVEGTKNNPKLPAKSLTPKPKMKKK